MVIVIALLAAAAVGRATLDIFEWIGGLLPHLVGRCECPEVIDPHV